MERPKEIDCRDIVGHWEIDCVVGKRDGKSVIMDNGAEFIISRCMYRK